MANHDSAYAVKDALLAAEDPWMPELPEILALNGPRPPKHNSVRIISSLAWNYLRMCLPGIQRVQRPVFWVTHPLNRLYEVRTRSLGSGYSACPDGLSTHELRMVLNRIANSVERFGVTHFHSAKITVDYVNRDGSFTYRLSMRAARVSQPQPD